MSCSRPNFSKKIVSHNGIPIPIPCRTCECCRMDKTNMWIERCNYELGQYKSSCFVTFTYDDECLPFSSKNSERPTLDYMHFHKFIDSLRHRARKEFPKYPNKFSHCDSNFKYIGSAEYGDKFERPHYHCIFFGLDPHECERFISRSWRYGAIKVLPVKDGAFAYVVKYIQKQSFGEVQFENYYSKGCLPPRLFISTGLGAGLYEQHSKEISEKGYFTRGQHRVYPPVYYKNKYRPAHSDADLFIESEQWKEIHQKYRHYKSLGGALSFTDWHISLSRIREQRLLQRKLKNLQITSAPMYYKSRPKNNFIVDKIIDRLKKLGYFFDGMPDFDSYKDEIPF